MFRIIKPSNKEHTKHVNNDIKDGKHVFVFVFMDGCGPCNETIPQWDAMRSRINNFGPNLSVSRIDKDLFGDLNNAGEEPMGYPTLRYINNGTVQDYEKSGLSEPKRETGSFLEWIKSKIKSSSSSRKKNKQSKKNKKSKKKKTRKSRKKKTRKSKKNKKKTTTPIVSSEEPLAEEPVTEEPLAEEPSSEPVVEEPLAEEPVVEEPATEEENKEEE